MTPINDAVDDSPKSYYNEKLRVTRCLIERVNGLLKMRFRCLLKHRVLHYEPIMAAKIIKACSVLHNMCIVHNVPEASLDPEDENPDYGIYQPQNIVNRAWVGRVNVELEAVRRIQRQVVNMLNQRRQQQDNININI